MYLFSKILRTLRVFEIPIKRTWVQKFYGHYGFSKSYKKYLSNYFIFFGPMVSESVPTGLQSTGFRPDVRNSELPNGKSITPDNRIKFTREVMRLSDVR